MQDWPQNDPEWTLKYRVCFALVTCSSSLPFSSPGVGGDLAFPVSCFYFLKDDESVPAHMRDTDEYRELMELKRLKRQKIADYQVS